MQGKQIPATIMAIVFFSVGYSKPTFCNSRRPCKFDGICFRGRCLCMAPCYNKGSMYVCGKDGNNYKNYCSLKMEACEMQREIEIECVGTCSSCSKTHTKSPKISWQGQIELTRNAVTTFCPIEDAYCLNYGLCVSNFGRKMCICPNGYRGERCQERKHENRAPRNRSPIVQTKNETHVSTVVTLVFCFMCLMGVGILVSAIYHRIKVTKIKKQQAKVKNCHEFSGTTFKDNICNNSDQRSSRHPTYVQFSHSTNFLIVEGKRDET